MTYLGGVVMRLCNVDGCTSEHFGLGFCVKHYKRFKRHGDPLELRVEKHGMYGTPEYSTWNVMIQRCTNENAEGYHRYGGRGIKVCDEWLHSFTAFFKDMGYKPFPRAQIDREDNSKGYTKNNCRWTTNAKNNQNRDNNKVTMVIARSIRKKYATGLCTYQSLANEYNISKRAVGYILNNQRWIEDEL